MRIKVLRKSEDRFTADERWGVFDDGGETMMAAGSVNTRLTRFGGKYLRTLAVGGLGTLPEYRRQGCVRFLFEEAFKLAPERGWVVSLLHPFSFSYYRKFGYEKIADHKILEFPMAALACFERRSDFKRLDSEDRLGDALNVFERFGANRNILFKRYDARNYNLKPEKNEPATFIWYDAAGSPASYVTLSVENYFSVNRMASVNLHVYETVFTTPESLAALFGFLRMYEGELDTVKIHNCAMAPEIDMTLRHYTHTKYTLVPDIMGRILNVEEFLKTAEYPPEPGRFTLKVEDTLDFTRGVYEVEYAKGEAEVRKTKESETYDIKAPMPALTQMFYGYEAYDAKTAAYLPGVELKTGAEGFFRAFPKRNNGLFEHF